MNYKLRSLIFSTLLACVSGSGWAQTAPEPFGFVQRENVATAAFVTSEAQTVVGFTGALAVSVVGGNQPQFQIDDCPFTSEASTIMAGQRLAVRHLSAASDNSSSSTTVNVGSYSTPFVSVTGIADRTPDAFGFGAKGLVAPGAMVESDSITPTGFNLAIPIVAGANLQYRIGSGAFTSSNGSLQPGQTLSVRHMASPTRLKYVKTTLRLGAVVGSFTTRTQGALEATAYPQGGLPSLSIADASANEAGASLSFTVSLSAAQSQTVSVDYRSGSATALAGKDYTEVSGTLSFAAGETSKTFAVPLLGDVCGEPLENFNIALSNPRAATVAVSMAKGGIVDDDPLGAPFKVGVAKRDVSPTAMQISGDTHEFCVAPLPQQKVFLGGFGLRDDAVNCMPTGILKSPVDGVQGAPFLRVMVLEQPAAPPLLAVRIAFVTLDAVGAGNIIQEGVKRQINTLTGIAKNNILFGQTHAHSGVDLQGLWGGVPFSWRQMLYTKAGEAAVEAVANLADAELGYTKGLIDSPSFNNYRRSDLRYGNDKQMTLLQAKRLDTGAVIATLLQYAAHPTGLGSGNTRIHGDWVAGTQERLEQQYPGSMALLYNGPIADASFNGGAAGSPPAGSDSFQRAVFAGRGLADRGIALLTAGASRLSPQIVAQHANAIIPITNQLFIAVAQKGWFNGYYDFTLPPDPTARATPAPQIISTAQTNVSRVTLGKIGCECLEVVTIPGEASNVVGQYIRSLAPRDMMLLGLTHNSFGYILSEAQYGTEETRDYPTSPPGPEDVLLQPTGYEESVSLGAATAASLREQAYNPLFGAPPGTGASPPTP